MVSYFQQPHQQPLLPNPIFDALYCDEQHRFDDDDDVCGNLKDPQIIDDEEIHKTPFTFLFEHDLFWEDDELVTLLSKEKKQAHLSCDEMMSSDGCLKTARNDAVKWMLKVIAHYGFTATTAVFAVTYYDRFITSVCFQKDKPWMSQLTAVACLSVAAKVEETQVPLLLDLQVEESKYLFEPKTIQRMELLLLSTLQWRMNPVTPISFFNHFARRFELITNLHWEYLRRCENIILSIVADCRLMRYLPSVIAAATMIHVTREIDTCDALEYQNQLMSVLKASKEEIDDCHKLITEIMNDLNIKPCHKRKHEPIPSSPSGVIDAYFSSDSSVDSWAVGSSVSSSPEPLFKRSRAQDQHMRLARLSVGIRRG
ncbi:hypothetical protein BUALT_Bualt04G0107800 [Buddleja alternifolia]|uniref:Cyclin D3 n=1 Tax=Buddleja alternifolia TaxID=168488 RepID=A0AAV6XYS3_9LAMI|nr:hypothetical protein BUALT_Bualt04G0107800 [Buddleja alternifolia]